MRRRAFVRRLSGGAAGLWVGTGSGLGRAEAAFAPGAPRPPLTVDGARLIRDFKALQRFGRNAQGGLDRTAYSDADLEAREFITLLLEEAGLSVRVDGAGNLIGRLPGTMDSEPWVIGSHIDSVPNGGHYDGQVGSMSAVEVGRRIAESDIRLSRPLEVMIFQNEEGGKTGSRALIGSVEDFELDLETASGFTIAEGIARLGGDPHNLDAVRKEPGSLAGFFELHVEQGGELEAQGLPIGVVEGIVGIRRWLVSVEGITNHAGTTPMARRTDAMVSGARFVARVDQVARSTPGTQVATVGRIQAFPGAPNVIPGRVELTLEIRDLAMEKINTIFSSLEAEAQAISRETGVHFDFEQFYESLAAPTAEEMRSHIERAARDLDLRFQRMPSGAGHDAQSMALLGPVGMIFVRSDGGISHAPEEHTPDSQIVAGANVLLGALLIADSE